MLCIYAILNCALKSYTIIYFACKLVCNTTLYLRTENTRAILPMARILFRMTSFRMAPFSVDDQEQKTEYNITLHKGSLTYNYLPKVGNNQAKYSEILIDFI